MDIYFRSFKSYLTTLQTRAVTYSLTLDALASEKSTATLLGDGLTAANVRDWVIAFGQLFSLSAVKAQGQQLSITMVDPLDAFDRKLEIPDAPADTVGGFIAQLLQSWVDETDPEFAVPYLQISNADTTPLVLPDVDSNGLFQLPAYVRLMRQTYGIAVRFIPAYNGIRCEISTADPPFRQVSFNDGRSELRTASFSSTATSKLTAIQDMDTGLKDENGNPIKVRERSTWYLSEEGEVSQTVPTHRAAGSWGVVVIPANADLAAKVAEEFAKGRTGHKLEFYSTMDIPVGAQVRCYCAGGYVLSRISSKVIAAGDNRYHYKGGELATTVTDKLKGV